MPTYHFDNLDEFWEAVRGAAADFNNERWHHDEPDHKEVWFYWTCNGEYDGGRTFVYRAPISHGG